MLVYYLTLWYCCAMNQFIVKNKLVVTVITGLIALIGFSAYIVTSNVREMPSEAQVQSSTTGYSGLAVFDSPDLSTPDNQTTSEPDTPTTTVTVQKDIQRPQNAPESTYQPPATSNEEFPKIDRSAYIQACNDSKEASIAYNRSLYDAEKVNHTRKLEQIGTEWRSRGMGFSGGYEQAKQNEITRHNNALAALDAQLAQLKTKVCA